VSSKRGALIIIKAILGRPIDVDLLSGPGEPEIYETVIAASPVKTTEGVQIERADSD
jgi:DEAD/DEAH box helicase domain-containing protein